MLPGIVFSIIFMIGGPPCHSSGGAGHHITSLFSGAASLARHAPSHVVQPSHACRTMTSNASRRQRNKNKATSVEQNLRYQRKRSNVEQNLQQPIEHSLRIHRFCSTSSRIPTIALQCLWFEAPRPLPLDSEHLPDQFGLGTTNKQKTVLT